MKNIPSLTAFVILFFCGCSDNKNNVVDNSRTSVAGDEKEIVELVKKMYRWQYGNSSKHNFSFLTDAADSIYIGIDTTKQAMWFSMLRNTGLFSENFIGNNHRIATTLDSMLRTGAFGDPWLVGDLPPYSSGTDPWCNCQDVPVDTAWWNEMKFRFIDMDSANATITWAWVDTVFDKSKLEYTVKLIKKEGKWTIDYLQGFDYETFTSVK